jgi:hypothetical protein
MVVDVDIRCALEGGLGKKVFLAFSQAWCLPGYSYKNLHNGKPTYKKSSRKRLV